MVKTNRSMLVITIAAFNNDDILYNGVTKKILDQVESFKELGINVSYTGIIGNKLYLIKDHKKICIGTITGRAYKDRKILYNYLTENLKILNYPTYVYIRHVGSDFSLLTMMKKFKQIGTKVIIEFPTYPYYREKLNNIKQIMGLILDITCNIFIRYFATISTNTNGYSKIFGMYSYNIENAVYIPRFRITKSKKKNDNIIHLIAVASMTKWHGYDRIIEGLREYVNNSKNKEKVVLHLVGEGPELNFYRDLCNSYKLKDSIVFHGNLGGEELDALFDICDIGLSSFGLYRIGLKQVSTLKVREYCARGIPFVYGYEEQSLSGNENFALKMPNDNSRINIVDIVSFYNRINKQKDISKKIRDFAVNNFTWSKQFEKMLLYIDRLE